MILVFAGKVFSSELKNVVLPAPVVPLIKMFLELPTISLSKEAI